MEEDEEEEEGRLSGRDSGEFTLIDKQSAVIAFTSVETRITKWA